MIFISILEYDKLIQLNDLKNASIEGLETLYCEHTASPSPKGCFQGIFLQRLDKPGNRRPLYYGSKSFEFLPFGIDFNSCKWYFFHPLMRIAKFRTQCEASRWRDCEVIKLHYDVSHLPSVIKRVLYDEIKPISHDLCLGLGGFNLEKDEGDQFYFALIRR